MSSSLFVANSLNNRNCPADRVVYSCGGTVGRGELDTTSEPVPVVDNDVDRSGVTGLIALVDAAVDSL